MRFRTMWTAIFIAVFLEASSTTPVENASATEPALPPSSEKPSATSADAASHFSTIAGSDLSPPPTEAPTGPPPDEDPFDCNITRPDNHIYLNCSFTCQGDVAVVVPNGEPCSLNHTELHSEDIKTTGTNGSIIGACYEGECIANRTGVAVPGSEPSTAETTSNSDVTGTPPKSPPGETTSTTGVPTESSPSEATTTSAVNDFTPPSSLAEPTTYAAVTATTQESTMPTTTAATETSSGKGPISAEHPNLEKGTPSQTPQTRPASALR